jgi:HEAT repeat protein/energy-coupling factor transporter ATP-binding protein EcfA2
VERVKKEKRPGEVSPEEGSQFYQPEREYEVTRTYKNDEFFAQVLKQGQSPKSQGRRLAVTGEPGAGKTTLLQKIALWVAAETEQNVAIWVSLADLQGRTVEEYLLQRWLKDALGAVRETPEMEEALALLFKSGRVWLLLDGVDEMAGGGGNPLAAVAAQITGWVAQARVVLSCRQNVWDAGKNALEGFDVYRNLDFDYPDGVAQFINRWFARHLELGERLLAELAEAGKERIRDTVRNPLRLALLCRAWQIRQGGLPEIKAGLYGQFAEALYEWKHEAFPTTSQQRRELNAGLGRLALRGMEQSESRFRLREGLVREVLGEKDEPLCRLALQLGWLNLVGVAVENPDERVYAFYHPTFQEYFAALAVDDWGYFLHHVPDNPMLGTYLIFEKQWKEVILLWFGRENVQKEKKEAFIEKLINFDDGCGSWNYPKVDRGFYEYRAYFLAGAILPEFKESGFDDAIVSQIVKWSCVGFIEPIEEGANAVLAEINRERAIAKLIQLLDETSYKYTRRRVADSLGKIAVGNEGAIARLILLFDETSYKYHGRVANILGKIAVGNEGAIARLILLLDETSDEAIRWRVVEILGNIAVENEGAIARLILLSDENETSDEYTRRNIAESLGKIAAVGNEGAIARLIQLFDESSYEDTRRNIAESLGKIAVGNERVIARLILLLDAYSDEFTRWTVVNGLRKIAVENEWAIARLIQFFDEIYPRRYTRERVADILRKIAVGNEGAIAKLIQLFDETSNEFTRRKVISILQNIAVGNEGAIARLIQLFDETSDEDTRRSIACILENIAVGNEGAIVRLIQLFDETSDEDIRERVADYLGKILVTKQQYAQVIFPLKDNLTDKIYQTNYDLYEKLYNLIWKCAQNLSYPEFYELCSNCFSVFEENPYSLERDTEKVIKILMLAENEAHRLGHDSLGTDHILLGIIAEGTNIAAKFLFDAGIKLKTTRFEVQAIVGRRPGCSPKEIPFTPRAQEVIDLASLKADQLGHAKVGSIHIFLALISQNESVAIKVLEKLGLDVHQLCSQIFDFLGYQESELRTNTSGKDSILTPTPTPTPTPQSNLWQKLWKYLNRPIF